MRKRGKRERGSWERYGNKIRIYSNNSFEEGEGVKEFMGKVRK
jgi:hypothetical protein